MPILEIWKLENYWNIFYHLFFPSEMIIWKWNKWSTVVSFTDYTLQGIIVLFMCHTCFIFRIIVAFVCSLILVTTKLAFIYFIPDIQIKFRSHCATCSAAAKEECERNSGRRKEAGQRWSECMACPSAQSKGLQIDKDMRLLGEQLTPVHVHVPAQPLSCSLLPFFLSFPLSLSFAVFVSLSLSLDSPVLALPVIPKGVIILYAGAVACFCCRCQWLRHRLLRLQHSTARGLVFKGVAGGGVACGWGLKIETGIAMPANIQSIVVEMLKARRRFRRRPL